MILLGDAFVNESDARISPDDRGYVFGDGIYEVFRVYGGKLFEIDAHMDRFERSAREVRIRLPQSRSPVAQQLEKLLDMNAVSEGIVYMQVTRGAAPRNHAFPADAEPVLYASCRELKRPLATMRAGIAAITRPDIRWLRCDIKSLNLLPNVLYKQEAVEAGAGEVIMHRDGTVTECSSSNVMMVKDGTVYTHPADTLILHGITRGFVMGLSRRLGVAIREEARSLDDFRSADEVFITGTTVEVTPVVSIDGHPVGSGSPGPIARKLQEAFENAIGA